MILMKGRLVSCLTGAALTLAGCAGPSPSDGLIHVVVGLYPYAYLAQQIGGDLVSVENLTRPGAEPHDLELTARQVAAVQLADLVIFESSLQPAVDSAVAQTRPARALDVTTVVPLEDHPIDDQGDEMSDPHIWLDPIRMSLVATAIKDQLAAIAPNDAAAFDTNYAVVEARLSQLDQAYRTGLATCQRTSFITTHAAFGYLADRYGLTQIAIAGMSPDAEPSPLRIADIQRLAAQEGITTIFFETLVSPALADAIAGDLRLTTDVLDPIEGITDQSRGSDYSEIMMSNLTALSQANGCR